MAQYKREMRTQELLRRRHSLNSQATDPSRASSTSLVTSATSNGRGKAGPNTGAASPAPSASLKSEGSASKGRGRGAGSSTVTTNGTPSKGAVKKSAQAMAAGSKRGRNGKVGAIHITGAPLTKAAKRFQKVSCGGFVESLFMHETKRPNSC